jgi:hypothetical protein
MSKLKWVLAAALLIGLVALGQPTWAAGELLISCEGKTSTGGGVRNYQYTLVNTGANPVTLTLFYVGTMDLAVANYTNWTAPAGFSAVATVADWNTLFNLYQTSVMSTTLMKTPHGVVPIPVSYPTVGGVVWSGSAVLAPNQQVTFGFDNPYLAWDMEWFAEHPDKVNSSQGYPNLPVAGPIGVFTQGFVHGPGEYVVPTTPSTFGRIKALYSSTD